MRPSARSGVPCGTNLRECSTVRFSSETVRDHSYSLAELPGSLLREPTVTWFEPPFDLWRPVSGWLHRGRVHRNKLSRDAPNVELTKQKTDFK